MKGWNFLTYNLGKKKKPKKGLSGADIMEESIVWIQDRAVCGTLNGWAKAWNAEPQLQIVKQTVKTGRLKIYKFSNKWNFNS